MNKTVILIFGLIGWMLAAPAINAEEASDIYALDLEELLDVKVTSVSKKSPVSFRRSSRYFRYQ